MHNEKLFFQYQKIEDKDRNYTIENLSKNQLHFSDPTKFNDPFDCKFSLDHIGTREQWINDYKKLGYNQRKAVKAFNEDLKADYLKKEDGGLYSFNFIKKMNKNIELGLSKVEEYLVYNHPNRESRKQIGIDMNDYIRDTGLPKICCFSEKDNNILMWSHYAYYHQGICLRFRSYKKRCKRNGSVDDILIDLGLMVEGRDYYLLNLYSPKTMEIVTTSIFSEVEYRDDLPESANYFDKLRPIKMYKFLLTKFSEWSYENEYRIMVPDQMLENNLLKYQKKALEGVVFGLKITHKNAKLVYETIKKNYLDEGIVINFYEAKEVPKKYEIKIEPIENVEKYIDSIKPI
ncbi:hypothetical protein SDC9_91728 [bioreactor metagenome]|uniref:DUF2971 domain-containing protein n=1 Tax=bioreactor metagenome TaxID=1076179 RepID=A0A645A2H1_9ZZZZ